MIEHPDIAAYWLGELESIEAERAEEHFFACAECAGRLEWLAALSEGVRAAVRAGEVGLAVSAPFVEALKEAGFRLREYRTEPGGRTECTIAAHEDAVVSRLRAPLAGVTRIDVLQRLNMGGEDWQETRQEDVPFDAASGEVIFLPPAAMLRKVAHTAVLRLVAVGEKGDAPLGEYTFSHTPS